MFSSLVRCGVRLSVVVTVTATLATPVWAQVGSITGSVVELGNLQPLDNAQISIPGTGIGGLSTVAGRYLLVNVPAGSHTLEVRLIGYAIVEQTVTVTDGGTAIANFELARSAIELGEIVITGAGQATERRRLGNTVAALNISEIEYAPVSSTSEILQARIPGVDVQMTGGHAGAGAQIRIRGVGSLSQSNGPIIYVDGVRVDNSRGTFPAASAPARLDDINPEMIERIEVLKGAAAATLYGTEASNGVIQIFTKRGRAGDSRWAFTAGAGIADPVDERDLAGFALGTAATPGRDLGTTALNDYWGINIQPYEVFEVDYDPLLFETGVYQDYSLSNSGGNEQITYFVVGRYSKEDGVLGGKDCSVTGGPAGANCFQLPDFDIYEDINEVKQFDASVRFLPAQNLSFELTTRYIDRTSNPQHNTGGTVAGVQLSKPERAHEQNSVGTPFFSTIREGFQVQWNEDTERYGGALKGAYAVTPNLNVNVTTGLDVVRTNATFLRPFGWAVDGFSGFEPEGLRQVTNLARNEWTLDASVSWDRAIGEDLTSSLVVGSQILVSEIQEVESEGSKFPGPGINVLDGGSVQSVQEEISRTVNNGVFLQEQVGFRDFLFVTAGARLDRHSAFGKNADPAFYPKLSGSFVVSDLPGWTGVGPISTLRFRAALGQSGIQPGSFDRFSTFSPAASAIGPALLPQNLGNEDLKPETTTEWEAGFEAGLLDDRFAVEMSYWNRTTTDLLIERPFPPSGGFLQPQLDNIGEMKAWGVDLGVSGVVVQRGGVTADVFVNGAYLYQEITDLGGVPPIAQGGVRSIGVLKEGRSPQSQFGAIVIDDPYPWDINGNGQPATEAEMLAFLAGPTTVEALEAIAIGQIGEDGTLTDNFLGKSVPDWQGSFGTSITWNDFSLSTNFSFKTGNYKITNHTMAFRNSHGGIGRNYFPSTSRDAILLNPASTAEQRLAAAQWFAENAFSLTRLNGANRVVDADFVRWRELSLTWQLPFAGSLGFEGMSVTASGRNIALWTKYLGDDPETISRSNVHAGHDAHIIATPRRFGVSIRVDF